MCSLGAKQIGDMASSTVGEDVCIQSEDGVPVVLRVKRKRTEDPAESLGSFQSRSARPRRCCC